MPLKKSEMDKREARRQVISQTVQMQAEANEWDSIKSHRKNNKDGYWEKSQKYREHMAKPKAKTTAKPKAKTTATAKPKAKTTATAKPTKARPSNKQPRTTGPTKAKKY